MRRMLVLVPLALAACGNAGGHRSAGTPVEPSGLGTARSYPVSGFTAVDVEGVDDAEVRTGGAFAVRAEGDPAVLDKLLVTQDGDTLRISRKPSSWTMGDKGAKLFVTMPRIARAAVSGTGDLRVDRVDGGDFAAEASGTGSIHVGAVNVGRATVSVSGAGDVTLAGSARMLSADVSGTGDLEAPGLRAARAEVSVAGTGSVRAAVNGPATVSASGTGDVDLGPAARCRVAKAGTGDVRCGG